MSELDETLRRMARKLAYRARAEKAWETKRRKAKGPSAKERRAAAAALWKPAPLPPQPAPPKVETRSIGALSQDGSGGVYTRDALGRIWTVHVVDGAWFAYGPARMVAAADGSGIVSQTPIIKRHTRRDLKLAIKRLGLDLSRYFELKR